MKALAVLCWSLVLVDLGLWLLALVLLSLPHVEQYGPPLAVSPFVVLAMLAFALVGAAIMTRRPRHPVGWIYCVSGLVMAIAMAGSAYSDLALADPAVPFAAEAYVLQGSFFWDSFLLPLTFGLLLFPDGRLPSPRWWPLAVLVGFVLVAVTVGPAVGNAAGDTGGLPAALVVAMLASVFGVAASVVVRWRRARELERAQLKWVGAAVVAFVVSLVVLAAVQAVAPDSPANASTPIGIAIISFAFMLVPIAIGAAILRYRLYDIDLLINRAVVYGATTAGIAVAFFAGIVVLQALLRPLTGGSEVAVATSTLVSVALFQPLRRRMQSAVDRRFYRSRYDAARTLDAFSVRLRDEVDLDAVRSDLIDVVASTVQPASASVWLRERAR